MKSIYVIVLFTVAACNSKPAYEGACIMEHEYGEGTPDSCWLDAKKSECKGTFVAQPSRDKAEIYCSLEGFKGDAKNGVLHRAAAKK